MDIYLYNTLTKKKEKFAPAKKTLFGRSKAHMYHCGPTVYDYAHIGNLRSYVFADTLRRLFEASGFKVKQVINITDIGHLASDADEGEDKMLKGLAREGLPQTLEGLEKLSEKYETKFKDDLADLNVITEKTVFPRASRHIAKDIELIQRLEDKGFAYRTADGIYFDTSKDPSYGRLGGLTPIDESAARVAAGGKKNPRDFALWKFSKSESVGFKTRLGFGFPGWHIECSAMAMEYLGETFDVHTGGIDHIPVHHNNEIAQSENATGKTFARFFMHNAFLTIQDGKMAKSGGNFITLGALKERGFSPMDYRYFLLGARYSTPLNFSWEALEAARNAYKRLTDAVCELPFGGKADKELWEKALGYAADDLDTPKVLALEWEILKDEKLSPADKKATILEIDALLGLAKADEEEEAIPAEVSSLLKEREAARAAKDWKRSDELRDRIQALGYGVKDTPEGQKAAKL